MDHQRTLILMLALAAPLVGCGATVQQLEVKCGGGSRMITDTKEIEEILASTDLTVLSGDDSLTLPLMALGARGVISVVGNLIPIDMIGLIAAFQSGNLEEAQRRHYRLFPLCRDMLGLATNPIPIKAAMQMLGRDTGELRLPMTPLDAALEARLRDTLVGYGLL